MRDACHGIIAQPWIVMVQRSKQRWVQSCEQDGLVRLGEPPNNRDELCRGLAIAEDNFREPSTQVPVGIQACNANIVKGKAPESLDEGAGLARTTSDVPDPSTQRLLTHHTISADKFRAAKFTLMR